MNDGWAKIYDDGENKIYTHKLTFRTVTYTVTYYVNPHLIYCNESAFSGRY